ncbi:alpha/beta hydrolase [Paenibacillus sp. MBLB4367]|uniref:alpha/beta hydrolase n=1 Tax=Paenibacillus sp. MBLB4367 TaxID=3384767 RepID=UPI003907FE0F
MKPQFVTLHSGALNRRINCVVYLPPDYETSDKRYPSVYLLHGLGGSELDWHMKGNASETIASLVKNGELAESIVVMPSDGGFDRGTFYLDWYDGSGNFEQYFIHDLVPAIDRKFRTVACREYRGIAGLSMGGYGAFLLSLRNPELFGAAASISGPLALMPDHDELSMTPTWHPANSARLVGPLGGPYSQAHNVAALAKKAMGNTNFPALYIDCGTEDYLYAANVWFKAELDKAGYPHQYETYPGEHNWHYFSVHLKGALRFLNAFLTRAGNPHAKE